MWLSIAAINLLFGGVRDAEIEMHHHNILDTSTKKRGGPRAHPSLEEGAP